MSSHLHTGCYFYTVFCALSSYYLYTFDVVCVGRHLIYSLYLSSREFKNCHLSSLGSTSFDYDYTYAIDC